MPVLIIPGGQRCGRPRCPPGLRRTRRSAETGIQMIKDVPSPAPPVQPAADDQEESWPGAKTAAAFAGLAESGRLDLPLPGSGHTRQRWAGLADLAEEDLSQARLAEGHTDAVAILAELGHLRAVPRDSRWGVRAAQPPGPGLTASTHGDGWRLEGIKRYCSGPHSCTDALVTAIAPDGNRLFAVSARSLVPVPGSWPAVGMAGSDTFDGRFDGAPAEPVGGNRLPRDAGVHPGGGRCLHRPDGGCRESRPGAGHQHQRPECRDGASCRDAGTAPPDGGDRSGSLAGDYRCGQPRPERLAQTPARVRESGVGRRARDCHRARLGRPSRACASRLPNPL